MYKKCQTTKYTQFAHKIFDIPRSLTGGGVRKPLEIKKKILELKIKSIKVPQKFLTGIFH